jgi:hypothetical protein
MEEKKQEKETESSKERGHKKIIKKGTSTSRTSGY